MKTFKPVTKSERGHTEILYRDILTKSKPTKKLTSGFRRSYGRISGGRIAMRHKGGGHKRLWRAVDFSYDKKNVEARIASVEYDPNRSGFIGLAIYADGEKRYVIIPQKVQVGHKFIVSETALVEVANRIPLKKVPVGTFVYHVALKPNAEAKLCRSAGNYAEVVAQDGQFTHLRMPSTEIRKVMQDAWCSIGAVSNEEHSLVQVGKAGRSRWKGIRPTVRGTAMNPVDHPHGGGEGRQGRGTRRAKSMWGKPTGKGQKTRTPKKYSNVFIVSRRKVGKNK